MELAPYLSCNVIPDNVLLFFDGDFLLGWGSLKYGG